MTHRAICTVAELFCVLCFYNACLHDVSLNIVQLGYLLTSTW